MQWQGDDNKASEWIGILEQIIDKALNYKPIIL
jgi:hypothetical protein